MSQLFFLHTAAVHVQTFDALLRELSPQTRARHVVREDLLETAQSQGADAPPVKQAVLEAIQAMGAAPDCVVLCTCSTIGGAAERAGVEAGIQVQRVDRAMADRAVAAGPNIVVAAVLESTLDPTESLIRESASRSGIDCSLTRLIIGDAWPLFQRGEFDAYLQHIAGALRTVGNCDVVVLAQASMAGAAELCADSDVPVLASPRPGLEAALASMAAQVDRL
jgi:hypothetical protein